MWKEGMYMKYEIPGIDKNVTIKYYEISRNNKNIIIYFMNGKRSVIRNTDDNLNNLDNVMMEQGECFAHRGSEATARKKVNTSILISGALVALVISSVYFYAMYEALATSVVGGVNIVYATVVTFLAGTLEYVSFKVIGREVIKEIKNVIFNIKNKNVVNQSKMYEYYLDNYDVYNRDKDKSVNINNVDTYKYKDLFSIKEDILREEFIEDNITRCKVRKKTK